MSAFPDPRAEEIRDRMITGLKSLPSSSEPQGGLLVSPAREALQRIDALEKRVAELEAGAGITISEKGNDHGRQD